MGITALSLIPATEAGHTVTEPADLSAAESMAGNAAAAQGLGVPLGMMIGIPLSLVLTGWIVAAAILVIGKV